MKENNMASECKKCGSKENYNFALNIGLCNPCIGKRIKKLEDEIQEVSNQLLELYDKCNETAEPEVYGTILGLHERLEQSLRKDK